MERKKYEIIKRGGNETDSVVDWIEVHVADIFDHHLYRYMHMRPADGFSSS
jgi:hypothetical protein